MAGMMMCMPPEMMETMGEAPDMDELKEQFQAFCTTNADGEYCGKMYLELDDDNDDDGNDDDDMEKKCNLLRQSGCCAGTFMKPVKNDSIAEICGFGNLVACAEPGSPVQTVRVST